MENKILDKSIYAKNIGDIKNIPNIKKVARSISHLKESYKIIPAIDCGDYYIAISCEMELMVYHKLGILPELVVYSKDENKKIKLGDKFYFIPQLYKELEAERVNSRLICLKLKEFIKPPRRGVYKPAIWVYDGDEYPYNVGAYSFASLEDAKEYVINEIKASAESFLQEAKEELQKTEDIYNDPPKIIHDLDILCKYSMSDWYRWYTPESYTTYSPKWIDWGERNDKMIKMNRTAYNIRPENIDKFRAIFMERNSSKIRKLRRRIERLQKILDIITKYPEKINIKTKKGGEEYGF